MDDITAWQNRPLSSVYPIVYLDCIVVKVRQDKQIINNFQAYLSDLWTKTAALKASGLTAEEAAAQVDMTNHSGNYAQIRAPGADVRGIRRIYELLDQ